MTQSGYPDFAGNTYREIGHYIVRFAALIDAMRNRLATQLTWGITPPNPVPYIVMGEMTAMPMANAFFGACRSVAELEDSELRVEKILISQVQEQIKFRNDIAHGDWEVDAWQYARTPPGVSELYRLRPNRRAGYVEATHISAEAIETRRVQVDQLRDRVLDYGTICLKLHDSGDLRVCDVLIVEDGIVRRDGPKTEEFPQAEGDF
jgi:hypothetical protein